MKTNDRNFNKGKINYLLNFTVFLILIFSINPTQAQVYNKSKGKRDLILGGSKERLGVKSLAIFPVAEFWVPPS